MWLAGEASVDIINKKTNIISWNQPLSYYIWKNALCIENLHFFYTNSVLLFLFGPYMVAISWSIKNILGPFYKTKIMFWDCVWNYTDIISKWVSEFKKKYLFWESIQKVSWSIGPDKSPEPEWEANSTPHLSCHWGIKISQTLNWNWQFYNNFQ